MPSAPLLSWTGQEYEHRPKSADWYVALAIVSLSLGLAAILFGNYLLALVIILGALVLGVHARQTPRTHEFRLTDQGLAIDHDLYPFDTMLSFSIMEDEKGALPPILSIKTSSLLSSHIVVPLAGVTIDTVHGIFAERVDEEEHPPTFTDMVASWLGF